MLVEIIGIFLGLIVFKLWGNSYTDWHGKRGCKEFIKEDKLKRPLWGVILLFIISILPILNIIAMAAFLCIYVYLLFVGEVFYHSDSKIFKWLNKDI